MLNKDKMTIHQCEKCGYETPYKSNLKQNLRRKTPYDKVNKHSHRTHTKPHQRINSPRITPTKTPPDPLFNQKIFRCESCCNLFSRKDISNFYTHTTFY